MPIGTKVVVLLFVVCLALSYQATQANPIEEQSAGLKSQEYDWFSMIFGDYDEDDDSEYLICRNCTVLVGQANATDMQPNPATMASTPDTSTASPTGDAPTAATAAPAPAAGADAMTPAPAPPGK
ncbi:uncharacterized protein LOC6568499 [Drosophila grimshawi]|uniref:GH14217 n=1 Tax=Drosophila grimshawi TaxID=7222 RepID=B4JV83_DROGR|nr:uncharacterized protein LOC6568499 [Drosophila grimshawi]EDV91403.1 GH14217 [Drosophila grimshawi]